jgi:hypothetical protein
LKGFGVEGKTFIAINPMLASTLPPKSHGFRFGRKAHQTVKRAKLYLDEEVGLVVDLTWGRVSDAGALPENWIK